MRGIYFVYLMGFSDDTLKSGITKNPAKRFKQLEGVAATRKAVPTCWEYVCVHSFRCLETLLLKYLGQIVTPYAGRELFEGICLDTALELLHEIRYFAEVALGIISSWRVYCYPLELREDPNALLRVVLMEFIA